MLVDRDGLPGELRGDVVATLALADEVGDRDVEAAVGRIPARATSFSRASYASLSPVIQSSAALHRPRLLVVGFTASARSSSFVGLVVVAVADVDRGQQCERRHEVRVRRERPLELAHRPVLLIEDQELVGPARRARPRPRGSPPGAAGSTWRPAPALFGPRCCWYRSADDQQDVLVVRVLVEVTREELAARPEQVVAGFGGEPAWRWIAARATQGRSSGGESRRSRSRIAARRPRGPPPGVRAPRGRAPCGPGDAVFGRPPRPAASRRRLELVGAPERRRS